MFSNYSIHRSLGFDKRIKKCKMKPPSLRLEVLQCYKHVFRTLNQIFNQDFEAINLARQRAREEFRKHSSLNDPQQIKDCIQVGYDAAKILRRTVIQAKLNERGNYEAVIRKENIDGYK